MGAIWSRSRTIKSIRRCIKRPEAVSDEIYWIATCDVQSSRQEDVQRVVADLVAATDGRREPSPTSSASLRISAPSRFRALPQLGRRRSHVTRTFAPLSHRFLAYAQV